MTPQPSTRKRLGDLLVDDGLLTTEELEHLLRSREEVDGRLERLGEAAVRLGYCSQDEIGMVLAKQLGLDYVDGHVVRVDAELAHRVPRTLAERHLVVPLGSQDGVLTVACVDPTNVVGLDDVRLAAGARRLRIVVAPTYTIRQAIGDGYGAHAQSRTEETLSAYTVEADEPEADLASANDGPIIALAEEIIHRAFRDGASDIHVEPATDAVIVRQRVDGVLHESLSLPRGVAGPLLSRFKLLGGLDIAERRKPQDGRAQFRTGPRTEDVVDLRLSTLPTMAGESVVVRLLRREQSTLDLGDLGVDAAQAAHVLATVERPQGLVLVTGPTGSGKTSTLYTLLAHLSSVERKLITIEDPIEYELPGVVQSQVNERAGYTLGRALRTMLRQDPDIVMVGEIRDAETAELALQASLTGHLVLSTLHTNDAPSAVVRLAELGMPGYLISGALTMVIAQRLVRRVCQSCAEPTPPTSRQEARLDLVPGATYVQGAGCPVCRGSGYGGRAGVFEILTVDSGLRELISDGASTNAIARAARSAGMRGMREDALRKAADGVTTLDEVLRVTPQPDYAGVHCPTCTHEVESVYALCPWCGQDLHPDRCTTCGLDLQAEWVACPACRAPVDDATADRATAPTPQLPRVLVVDDDLSVRDAMIAMLTGDFEVVHAETGAAALAALHGGRIDVIVVDKGLPDMDGYALTRTIRTLPEVRDLPVMVMTGYDDPQSEMDGLRAGADDWLAKPVDLEVLVGRLNQLLGRRAIHAT